MTERMTKRQKMLAALRAGGWMKNRTLGFRGQGLEQQKTEKPGTQGSR
jgi:hypothetical protein